MTTLEDMTKKKAEPSAEAAARAIRSQNAALRPCSVTTTGRCSWFQGERLREDRIPVPRTRRRCGATSAVGFGSWQRSVTRC